MKLTKDFNLSEFACRDYQNTEVPKKYFDNVSLLADQLQILRDYLGEPIRINSGYRTPAYNKSIGGATKSQHLTASAADIATKSNTPKQLASIVEQLIKQGKLNFGGIGVYKSWIHTDIRKIKARWQG